MDEFLRRGEITLAYGTHQIIVPLVFKPRVVTVSCRSEGIQVCSAGKPTGVEFEIREDGIHITANVTCNYEIIEWTAR